MPKQVLLDILIVLALPALAIFGYFYFNTTSGTKLLSDVSMGVAALPGEGNAELGTKTKIALNELKSINFDKTLFTDATFLTLEDFTLPIIATPIGREYPFALTPELRTMSKKAKPTEKLGTSSTIIKIPVNADISQKLNLINGGVR